MRPALLSLLLSPLLRHPSSQSFAVARRIVPPVLEYPTCSSRILTPSGQHHQQQQCLHSTMASSRPDDDAEQAERVAAPPCEETSKQGVEAAGEASGPSAPPAEAPLPKLSAAEFRAYNTMATSMEYFVRGLLFVSMHLACFYFRFPCPLIRDSHTSSSYSVLIALSRRPG